MKTDIAISGENNLAEAAQLTDAELAAVQMKLARLLSKRAQRYTGGESSSLPEETAAELLASIRYAIASAQQEKGLSERALPAEDFDALFALGTELIGQKAKYCRILWQAACDSAPMLGSRSLSDTLRSIGKGFEKYDFRYFAHAFPCDIDYQLAAPVPETLVGADYIAKYLRRLIIENRFIGRFAEADIQPLLRLYCPDHREQLVNLYEPVFANALGRILLNAPPLPLSIAQSDIPTLEAALTLPSERLRTSLKSAAQRLCGELRLADAETADYCCAAALALLPRIKAALPHGGLAGIFIASR